MEKKLPCIIVHYYCHMCVLTFQVFWGVPFHGVHEKHNSNTLLFVRDASLYTQHSSHTVCHVPGWPRKKCISWALHNILRYNVNIHFQLGLVRHYRVAALPFGYARMLKKTNMVHDG